MTLCSLAYGPTLAPGITWANGGLDSGELVAVAATGGVPHPSGYPSYLLLTRALVLLLPWVEPARAVTLLSPLAATLTALVIADLVRRWCAAREPMASVAGALAALALALAPLFWSQAVIAEVYSLSALFTALLLRAALLATLEPPRLLPGAVLAGLALGAHLTVMPFVLAWVLCAWRGAAHGPWAGRAARIGGGLAAGLLVYLYLPIAARASPPISWGDAASWQGFWWLVSGRLYAPMAFGLPQAALGPRLLEWGQLLIGQLGAPGLILAGVGLASGGRGAPMRLVTASLAGATLLFAIGYNSFDAQVYLIPALLIGAFWIGLGAATILSLAARPPGPGPTSGRPDSSYTAPHAEARPHRAPALPGARPGWLAPLVAVALAAGLLWHVPSTARQVDASDDRRAIDYAAAMLAQAPPGAVLLTDDDRSAFPLWHDHFGRGRRPDLRLIVGPLLGFAWYRESLRATYPDLPLPDTAPEGWDALLAELPGPLCRAVAEPEPELSCR